MGLVLQINTLQNVHRSHFMKCFVTHLLRAVGVLLTIRHLHQAVSVAQFVKALKQVSKLWQQI